LYRTSRQRVARQNHHGLEFIDLKARKRQVLLVEPGYKNKYPPLGLMKIASYHRLRGDQVVFVKGNIPEYRDKKWDRIYITTLFTFYWKQTVDTIRYYGKSAGTPDNVFVGGILATLMADQLEKELSPELNVRIIKGLLDKPRILDRDCPHIVENMVPNYSILDDIDYTYGMADGYLGYATRGCVNNCSFCAVRTLEPDYKCEYHSSVIELVRSVDALYGQKRDLLLLDNNILASPDFEKIIHEILDCGFEKGATLNRKNRHLDFNQGIDARLLTVTKMELLSRTALSPLRLAFDNSRMQKSYENAVHLAVRFNVIHHSTYVLYNHTDTPEDFYRRIRVNVELNQALSAKISSFPMKYIPLNHKDRSFVGKHWHRKLLRGVQCILLVTKGMVSPRLDFFNAAFGRNEKEFREICMMPDDYIIYRNANSENAAAWRKLFRQLSTNQKQHLLDVLAQGSIREEHCAKVSGRLQKVMEHYLAH